MTDLPDVRPQFVIPEADLQAAFTGLEPGWYSSADLLPRYNAWAAQKLGRGPVTAKTLGEAIARELKPQGRRKLRGRSLWWLDEAALTHRDWFRETK